MTPSFVVFNAFLEWEGQQATRYQEAFALALISLDRTTTNDRGQGERAMLGIVAENVRKAVRQADLVAQTADTVSVLLLYVDRTDTMRIAEKVRAQIKYFRRT